jgi:hypothetical protein
MSSGDIKINRIKSANRGKLGLLGDVTKLAIEVDPILKKTASNRDEFRRMEDAMSALGAYCRKSGFDPTRTFQHVANFDNAIWTLVLEMFAKYNNDGELMDDGLLYKTDPKDNTVKLNKDFFYALVSYFEGLGIPCDMRGKITLN